MTISARQAQAWAKEVEDLKRENAALRDLLARVPHQFVQEYGPTLWSMGKFIPRCARNCPACERDRILGGTK